MGVDVTGWLSYATVKCPTAQDGTGQGVGWPVPRDLASFQ